MGLGDVSLACAAALVDALVAGGVEHACLSPGSRSTPLALALARDGRLRVHVHLDERSSAFSALGIAKVTGAPAIVGCTSGTAAAELFPAVVEASQSRTPLILVTADRPPALRGTGANQTIVQEDLFGRYARAYVEPPVPGSSQDVAAWRDAGRRALEACLRAPPGPAHLNAPFDEPLVPEGGTVEVPAAREDAWAPIRPEPDLGAAGAALDGFLAAYAGLRGVLTLGALRPPRTLALLSLGTLLGWPVLAEPLSGLRLNAGGAGRALGAGQFLVGDPAWLDRHRPEVVLQVGARPTTRATEALVAAADALVVLDHEHLDPDPLGRAERRIKVDPERFAAIAWDRASADDRPAVADPTWLDAWRDADLLAHAAVDRILDGWEESFEGRIARDLASFVPNGAVLAVGSSTPVRDLDVFMAPRRPPRIWQPEHLIRLLANRGASGIDGFVSTVLGAASATDAPVYALMGDLTFLHDAGGLLWGARRDVDTVMVVVANGGGQIFSLLPQRDLPEHEALFVTPSGIDIHAVCEAGGAAHRRVETGAAFVPALEGAAKAGGVQVVEVGVDAALGIARRAGLRDALTGVLGTAGGSHRS
jgi:2-succinyl-5-enolpyruvyl-6-hydroxy-3-cyclohexene-1-carboxylate synthase